MIPFIGPIISAIFKPVGSAITGWSARKTAKLASETRVIEARTEAQIKRIESGDSNAAVMDQISAGQRGWKDDYLLILTTFPLVLLFVGPVLELFMLPGTYVAGNMTDAILEGFLAMDHTPEYYWWALGMIYIDTFGFRRMLRTALEGWAKSKFGKLL